MKNKAQEESSQQDQKSSGSKRKNVKSETSPSSDSVSRWCGLGGCQGGHGADSVLGGSLTCPGDPNR